MGITGAPGCASPLVFRYGHVLIAYFSSPMAYCILLPVYNAFREGGWISQGFGKITDAYSNYPLVALGLTVAMFFSYRAWRNATASGGGGKIFDLMVEGLGCYRTSPTQPINQSCTSNLNSRSFLQR